MNVSDGQVEGQNVAESTTFSLLIFFKHHAENFLRRNWLTG